MSEWKWTDAAVLSVLQWRSRVMWWLCSWRKQVGESASLWREEKAQSMETNRLSSRRSSQVSSIAQLGSNTFFFFLICGAGPSQSFLATCSASWTTFSSNTPSRVQIHHCLSSLFNQFIQLHRCCCRVWF